MQRIKSSSPLLGLDGREARGGRAGGERHYVVETGNQRSVHDYSSVL